MKKVLAFVLSLVMVLGLAACTNTPDPTVAPTTQPTVAPTEKPTEAPTEAPTEPVPAEVIANHAEFMAAEKDSEITIQAAVQFSGYNEKYGNTSVFLQDEDGGYFIYRMNVTPEQAAQLTPGTIIKVHGFKTNWAGLEEIDGSSATFEVVDGKFEAPAADITARLGADDLIKDQSIKVAVKGATVASKALYSWDGSGQAGANNDLYFDITVDGKNYTFTVETDECPEGSDVYNTVLGLNVGDTIDLEGFLYWYNAPQIHVHNVEVTAKAAAYVPYTFQLKNKTGVIITAAYFYVAGAEDKGESVVPEVWVDKDMEVEENNYEQFIYIVRPEAEKYEWTVVFEDGTEATWEVEGVQNHDEFSFKKGTDPEKWEHELQEDPDDVAAMDAWKAYGLTADGFYPGYVKIGLELKNKTEEEKAIAEFYFYEKGADHTKYPNMIGNLRDAENNFEPALDENGLVMTLWKAGSAKKGGLYVFTFFIRPVAEFYEVYIVFEDGSTLTVEDIPNLVIPTSAGTVNNELSFKSAVDPDQTKIQYDDNEADALPYIAAAIKLGISGDEWYPEY